jgi:hypothetical protein
MVEIKPMDESYVILSCIHGGPFGPADTPDTCMVGQDWVPPHPWTDETIVELAVSYWRVVRQQTQDYLGKITDADLGKVPETSLHPPGGNRDNPIREWSIMTIQHQNKNQGELCIVKRLIAAAG